MQAKQIHRVWATLLALVGAQSLVSQGISGVVKDEFNQAVENVLIEVVSSHAHSHTNALGQFKLDYIMDGDSLRISHVGFEEVFYVVRNEDFEREIQFQLQTAGFDIDQVEINTQQETFRQIALIDIKTNPVKSSQEILQKVPGMVIGQHAGGGKAEQIFLRGFDIDHGTDVSIEVDGMPVNMVSHAHGQGYSDLHFLTPELIQNVDYGKGSYYADKGNFGTAGYVSFQTKNRLEKSNFSLERGMFGYQKGLGQLKLYDSKKVHSYLSVESILSDGPFESSQNFSRNNVIGKIVFTDDQDHMLSVSLMHFYSKWDASGQIPTRSVNNGTITRWGAVDDTEGGSTSRSSVVLNHVNYLNKDAHMRTTAYVSHYDFELFSNFTFFLDDPVNGDQIRQFEDRMLYGAKTEYNQKMKIGEGEGLFKAGMGMRYDDVDDVLLSHTANRKTTLETYALGDVDEVNSFVYGNMAYEKGRWTVDLGVRADHFNFGYQDRLTATYENYQQDQMIVSPKLSVHHKWSDRLGLYLKTGTGYHSNDSRVSSRNLQESTLPRSMGGDLGAIFKPADRWVINVAAWALYLEQEFVYVGDAGIVEPSGETRRLGGDLEIRGQLSNHIFTDLNVNYSNGRSIGPDAEEGNNLIPLAPDWTASLGISLVDYKGFSSSLRYRFVDDRPANEDNSIIAEGYGVTDFNLNYSYRKWGFGLIIQNLFDVEWNETQFATETRLLNEAEPVEEIHFTPGTPFTLSGKISFQL